MTVLIVGAGGLAGVLARYGLTVWEQSLWTIVAINIVGSFALGVMTHVGVHLSHDVRTGIGVGFLGGFTTFSTMTVQTVLEADGGNPSKAALYLFVSVAGGMLAALAGYYAGRAIA
ncbi:fluoride efflux transporter CrcB [soil metagenome]